MRRPMHARRLRNASVFFALHLCTARRWTDDFARRSSAHAASRTPRTSCVRHEVLFMSHIDEGELARVMEVLPDVLAREEMVVQRCLPLLSSADVLDAALKRSLTRLRFQLDQDSFDLLRSKVAMARAEHRRTSGPVRAMP